MAATTAPKPRPKHPAPHRFTVAEFGALLDTRPFVDPPDADTRFERVDGCIYGRPPMNDPRRLAVQPLTAACAPLVASRRLLVNAPVSSSESDEPCRAGAARLAGPGARARCAPCARPAGAGGSPGRP